MSIIQNTDYKRKSYMSSIWTMQKHSWFLKNFSSDFISLRFFSRCHCIMLLRFPPPPKKKKKSNDYVNVLFCFTINQFKYVKLCWSVRTTPVLFWSNIYIFIWTMFLKNRLYAWNMGATIMLEQWFWFTVLERYSMNSIGIH